LWARRAGVVKAIAPKLNICSELFLERIFSQGIIDAAGGFKELTMRKLVLSFAALAAFGLAIPYAAPAMADPIIVVHHRRPHPVIVMPHHHRYYDHSSTVIIKHR
jgi:hypothetical protein